MTLCHDGQSGYERAKEREADVIVLDLMLPVLSGDGGLCPAPGRRSPDSHPRVDRSGGGDGRSDVLNLGADDYLRKPFSYPVLVARCRALLRRPSTGGPAEIVVGDLVLEPRRRRCAVGETPIELTRREFALLEYLMRSRDGREPSRRSSTTSGASAEEGTSTSSRCTWDTCVARWTYRSTGRRSGPFGARATCSKSLMGAKAAAPRGAIGSPCGCASRCHGRRRRRGRGRLRDPDPGRPAGRAPRSADDAVRERAEEVAALAADEPCRRRCP